MANSVTHDSGVPLRHDDGSGDKHVFDFFGLPPELRNMIYSYLTENVTVRDGNPEDGESSMVTRVTVENKLLSTPLLLSRQFKIEYEDEMRHRQMIVFRDRGDSLQYKPLPDFFNTFPRVKMQVAVICNGQGIPCKCNDDIEDSVEWMKSQLSEFTSLRAVKVELRPCVEHTANIEWIAHAPRGITRVAGLEDILHHPMSLEIEVYPSALLELEDVYKAWQDQRPPLKKWNRAGGWQDCDTGDE